MPSTESPNKGYEEQATNENVGTWGVLLNAVLTIIDLNLGGRLSKTIDTADVVLSTTETRNLIINLNGTLTGNRALEFPATKGGVWLVYNGTTGGFTVTVKPTGGTGVVIPQGGSSLVAIDPSNTRARLFATPDVMTARGDLVTRDVNTFKRLPRGTAGQYLSSDGSDLVWASFAGSSQSFGLISGVETSRFGPLEMTVQPGVAADRVTGAVMTLGSAMTKRIDQTWSLGSGGGFRDTGALTDGWWYPYVIQRSDTGIVDMVMSLNPTLPSLPASYDRYRRIGSMLIVSGQIRPYHQYGDWFDWDAPAQEYSLANPGTGSIAFTVSAPPLDDVVAQIRAYLVDLLANTVTYLVLKSVAQSSMTPSGSNFDLVTYDSGGGTGVASCVKHLSMASGGVLRYQLSASSINHTVSMETFGWTDSRGRNG